MSWTKGPEGYAEFTAPTGERMRILPPPDSGHNRWAIEDHYFGRWVRGHAALDETEARAKVEDLAEHYVEVAALGRHSFSIDPRKRVATPGGSSEGGTVYAEGIVFHSTPGHGYLKLDAKRNKQVFESWRAKGGWYEEDSAINIAIHTFPQFFTSRERRFAENDLKNRYPHEYEAATGRKLDPSESFTLRREIFERDNAQNWVVISASLNHDEAVTIATATLGGERGAQHERKVFLIPSGEYDMGEHGFVVDPARYPEQDAASPPSP